MSNLIKHSILALITVLLLSALSGCNSLNVGGTTPSFEKNADSRSTAPMEGMAGGSMAPGAPIQDMAFSEEGVAASPAAESKPPGSSGPQLKPEDFLKQQVNIDSWFSPKAYAAENIPDTKYLIRTGDLTLKVKKYDEVASQVEATAVKFSGIVTDSNSQQQYDGSRNGYLRLRVPNEQFRACYDALKELGEVTAENISSQDVSHDYVTAVSRLKALLTEQETLRVMLAEAREVQKTRGLGEAYSVLLETQARLSEVTAQVQGIEDQISQLADQITRSTITVNLNEIAQLPPSGDYEPGYGDTWERAKRDFVRGRDDFINGVIYFVGSFWGLFWLLIIGGIIWWVVRKVRKASWADRSAGSRGPKSPPKS